MSKNTAKSKKTDVIPKAIQRNVEIPLKASENRRSVIKHPVLKNLPLNGQEKSPPKPSKAGAKYKVPELNTALCLSRKMEELRLKEPPKYKSTGDLTPRSKVYVESKVNQQLNFPPDKPVFKNLIPINVNNVSLQIPEKKVSIRKKYTRSGGKDPVPNLADFLDPVPMPKFEFDIAEPELRYDFKRAETTGFRDFCRYWDFVHGEDPKD